MLTVKLTKFAAYGMAEIDQKPYCGCEVTRSTKHHVWVTGTVDGLRELASYFWSRRSGAWECPLSWKRAAKIAQDAICDVIHR